MKVKGKKQFHNSDNVASVGQNRIMQLLSQTAKIIEPEAKKYLEIQNKELQEMVLYTFAAGGKRIRPLLVRLGCEAVGGNFIKILPAAVCIELIHTTTLVLDDVFDNALERRGKRALHRLYGAKNAIIVSALLKSLAIVALVDVFRRDRANSDVVQKAVRIIESAYLNLHMGEYWDLKYERYNQISESRYMAMIEKTSASLTQASLQLGAVLGRGNEEEVDCLLNYGLHFGKALQIRNDIADLLGDEVEMGRKIGEDIRQNKKSLPILYALQNLKGKDKHRLRELLGKNLEEAEVKEAVNIIVESGAISNVIKVIETLTRKAKKAIENLPNSEAKEALLELTCLVASFQ